MKTADRSEARREKSRLPKKPVLHKSYWQLIVSGTLLVMWILFLAWIALFR